MNTAKEVSDFYWDYLPGVGGRWMVFFCREGLLKLLPSSFVRGKIKGSSQKSLPFAWRRYLEVRLHPAYSPSATIDVEQPPLLLLGSSFQKKIWSYLQTIPWGQVRTYGQIALAIRAPDAARAVGGACGANPLPILVPCHRVLSAQGSIGGFTWGKEWKLKLLALEGILPEPNGRFILPTQG